MKTNHFLSLIILLFFVPLSYAQTFDSAIDYLNFIGEEQTEVTKSMWKYTKAVAHSKRDSKISKRREQLIDQITTSKKNITKANGFDGNDFKNNVLELIRVNESILKQDYAQIIDMKEVAEQSYDLMEAYILAQELADKKMEESQATYEKQLLEFAGKHKINIVENDSDLSKKMAKSNEVFSYNNKLYLLFFKVYINDVYLNEAINTKDLSGIQQNSNALNIAAKNGLEQLETMEAYGSDKALLIATKEVFDFYVSMTTNDIPKLIDFHILEEEFKTLTNSIEQTPAKKRTKEQIDTYNKKVKAFNNGVATFNKTNQNLNNNKQRIFNDYENTKQSFLSRHIPND